jgi:hypothetical protein
MKKILLIIVGLTVGLTNLNAQNSEKSYNDNERVVIAAYVPKQIENFPEAARSMLMNKLNQILSNNGLGGSASNERFILTANCIVQSKSVTSTAPAMQAYNLQITFCIGDGISGTKFSSYSLNVKGVGETETKAYISAIKNINPNNENYQDFITLGKKRIIEYYNSQCDLIITEAKTLESKGEFQGAIYKLSSVPPVCKECYVKTQALVGPIFQKYIDFECQTNLATAKRIWSAGQSYDAANEASVYLAKINPNSACFKSAMDLNDQIAKRIKELDQREWNFMLKQQQDQVDIEKATIKAIRDIGVAYGENQPDIVYETVIYSWW